jgi:RNA recognition motif-containing protein
MVKNKDPKIPNFRLPQNDFPRATHLYVCIIAPRHVQSCGLTDKCRVYVQNLEERAKVDKVKEALSQVFSEYGSIIDIVAKTNLRAKGQAFVVFDKPEAAQAAIEDAQGFELFDKPMRLSLARTRSDATVMALHNDDEFELHRRRRMAEKGEPPRAPISPTHCALRVACRFNARVDKRRAADAAEEMKRLKRQGGPQESSGRPAKPARGAGLKSSNPTATAVVPDEYLPPNKILFVQNLPDDYDVDALTALFGRFEGFREIRLVPGRKRIAFVEYEAEQGAITAKENTAGMPLGDAGQAIKVTYQRQ